jgi:WD40 repeat protein
VQVANDNEIIITLLKFSPTASTFVTAGLDHTARVWQVLTLDELKILIQLMTHESPIWANMGALCVGCNLLVSDYGTHTRASGQTPGGRDKGRLQKTPLN